MKLSQAKQLESQYVVHTYDRQQALFVRGEGAYLFDERGRRYLDFLSGIGVNALGYAHPAITKAIAAQSKKLIHCSNIFFHEYQGALAEKLTEISGLEQVFFCNSGTEAFEAGLKFARAYAKSRVKNGGRPKWRVLAMSNSFHGRTYGSLATTGQLKYRKPFAPLPPGVVFVEFNDVADLKKKFDSTVCAIALETIQGEGGVRPVTAEFMKAARALTRKHDALLLVDEIQTGLGRTGKYFAYQHYAISPDLVTVAKPLAAGLPLGALLTTKKVANAISPGMHGTTFGGGPLACSVALEFLRVLEKEKLVPKASKLGAYFRAALEALDATNPHITDVRGIGLMLAMELDSTDLAKHAVKEMLKRGVIINRTADKVLRFLPPYIVTEGQIDEVVNRLGVVLLDANHRRP